MAPIVEKQTRKARRQRQNSLNGTGLEEDELAELVFASKQHDAFEDVRHLPHKTSLVALICSVPLGAGTCPPKTSHPPALPLPGGLRLAGFIPGQRSGDIRHARPDVRIPNPSAEAGHGDRAERCCARLSGAVAPGPMWNIAPPAQIGPGVVKWAIFKRGHATKGPFYCRASGTGPVMKYDGPVGSGP